MPLSIDVNNDLFLERKNKVVNFDKKFRIDMTREFFVNLVFHKVDTI